MKYILFTTTRCPKCPAFKSFVAKNISFEGEILDETHPHFSQKITECEVTNAPTILIFDGENEVLRATDISQLDTFLRTL